MVPQVHQGIVTPSRRISIRAPRCRFFLLRGRNLRSHTKFRSLERLEGEFDYLLRISRHSQFFSEHCSVAVTLIWSILAQSEGKAPRFS